MDSHTPIWCAPLRRRAFTPGAEWQFKRDIKALRGWPAVLAGFGR